MFGWKRGLLFFNLAKLQGACASNLSLNGWVYLVNVLKVLLEIRPNSLCTAYVLLIEGK